MVWAIEPALAPLYSFPRDCTRVTVWAHDDAQRAVLRAVEEHRPRAALRRTRRRAWVRATRLLRTPSRPSRSHPGRDAEGQWVAHARSTTGVVPLDDLVEAHVQAGVDLRFDADLPATRATRCSRAGCRSRSCAGRARHDPRPRRAGAYGWTPGWPRSSPTASTSVTPARVVGVTRTTCRVATPSGEVIAVAEDMPAVGDWVASTRRPARLVASPTLVGAHPAGPPRRPVQVLAANVDLVLVTCPADRPSIDRVERETVLAWDAGAQPVVLVTKADLETADALVDALRAGSWASTCAAPRHATTTASTTVAALLAPDRTAVVLGPSGRGSRR